MHNPFIGPNAAHPIMGRLPETPSVVKRTFGRRPKPIQRAPVVYPFEVFERVGGSLAEEDMQWSHTCPTCDEYPAPREVFVHNRVCNLETHEEIKLQDYLKGYIRGLCACERKEQQSLVERRDDARMRVARTQVMLKEAYRGLHPIANYEALANNRPEHFEHETLALEMAWMRMEDFLAGPNGFLLVDGPFASGKTLFISILVRALVERGYSCLYTKTTDLYHKYKTAPREEQIKLLDRLRTRKCLVLDDFHLLEVAGAGYVESDAKKFYDGFFEARYMSNLITILGTNLKLDDQLEQLAPFLTGHLRSRINANKMIITLETRDQRVVSGNWEPKNILPFVRPQKPFTK